MYDILTVKQAYQADHLAEESGVPGYALMRRAGAAVANAVKGSRNYGPVQVLCGPGANGGDGYVAAKLLQEAGREPQVLCVGDPAKLCGDAGRAFADWNGVVQAATADKIIGGGVIVDALFGAGLARPLGGALVALVEAVNESAAHVISVDLPSGIFGDQGHVASVHILADETVTFFRKKQAHVLEPARSACGVISVADIGIPDQVLSAIRPNIDENHPSLWPGLPPLAAATTYKHARGHVLVRCGDALSTGAARLAARAALRAGAGLVSLLAEDAAARVCAAHETEVMIIRRGAAQNMSKVLHNRRFDAAIIGPAGGVDAAMRQDVTQMRDAGLPLVVDADALSAFAEQPEGLFARLDERCVMTPHEGEFARLFPDLGDRTKNKVERTRVAAARAGCVVVLKGPDTVIAAPDGRAIVNTNACAALATAGSGDVLAGMIGAVLAQGQSGFNAAACGVWLHGAAGTLCGRGLIAGDLPDALPEVLQTQL